MRVHYHYFTLEQREALERLIRSTQPALLERLHGPAYGVCEDCGGDIPYVRLLAAPGALLCNHCEKSHVQAHPDSHGRL